MKVDNNLNYLQQTYQNKTNKTQNQNQQLSFNAQSPKTDTFTQSGGMASIDRLMNEVGDSELQNQEQNSGSNFLDSLKNMMSGLLGTSNESSESGDSTENASEASGAKGGGSKGGGSPGIPEALQSILSSLGLSPSGSKESDYSMVMNHLSSMESSDPSQKQNVSALRENFLSVYSSL